MSDNDMKSVILVIEDDTADFEILAECLRQSGFKGELVHASDGEEALTLLADLNSKLPRLIILDLWLPKMSGMEILDRLKALYQIPTVVHTTDCSDEVIKASQSRGAIGCLKKGTTYADNLRFARHIMSMIPHTTASNRVAPL